MSETPTALVTGASSGIGAAYADRLGKRGYGLILVARNRARLDSLAERLRSDTGRPVDVLPADLTHKAALLQVEDRLRTDANIAMLVNNAGMAVAGALLASDPDHLESMVQLNTVAPMRLARAAVEGFTARGRGTISSVLALAPELFNGAYSATKSFLLNLSLALNAELRGQGVRPSRSAGRNADRNLGKSRCGCQRVPGRHGDGGRRDGRCGARRSRSRRTRDHSVLAGPGGLAAARGCAASARPQSFAQQRGGSVSSICRRLTERHTQEDAPDRRE